MIQSTIYTVPQIASMPHIGRNAAYALIKSGQLRSVRIGKTLRIPESTVEDFLKSVK